MNKQLPILLAIFALFSTAKSLATDDDYRDEHVKHPSFDAVNENKDGMIDAVGLVTTSARSSDARKWPGKKTDFRGFECYEFWCEGRPVKVLCPQKELPGAPWEWRGSFWGKKVYPNTEMTVLADVKLLEAGYYVVIAGSGIPLGHPSGMPRMDAFYKLLTEKYGLNKKPVMMGLSREALSVYRWASANPEKVSGIYIDGGVCSLKSWPGGRLVPGSDAKGIGSVPQWELAKKTYGFTSDAEALAYDLNPIDLLEPLARAGVPLLHVAGLADTVVPYDENAAVLEARYRTLGGSIEVIAVEGRGHVHGLEDPTPILEFMKRNTTGQTESFKSTGLK